MIEFTKTAITSVLLAVFLLPAHLPGQWVGGEWSSHYRFEGAGRHAFLGGGIAGTGDLDGDGVPDFAIGSGGDDFGGKSGAGRVLVWSGAGGLIEELGSPVLDGFGRTIANVGDLDLDGTPDFAVAGAGPGAQLVLLVSGRGTAVLHKLVGSRPFDGFGTDIAGLGDVNGDGVPDVLVSEPFAGVSGMAFAGVVHVFSGATGARIYRINGTGVSQEFGNAIAVPGDLNGDGVHDFAVDSRENPGPSGGTRPGRVSLHSGVDGALLLAIDGPAGSDAFGAAIAPAGDWNGDGVADLLAGDPTATSPGAIEGGAAFVHSGADGSLLLRMDGLTHADYQGVAVAPAGDLDQDGFPDYWVSGNPRPPGQACPGSLSLYSGRDGSLAHRRYLDCPDREGFSSKLAIVGDLDGNGTDEVLLGLPRSEPRGEYAAGSAIVYGFDPHLRLDRTELPARFGETAEATLDFPGSEAGRPYALLFSLAGTGPVFYPDVQVPLTPDSILWRMLRGWTPPNVPAAYGVLDPDGEARVAIGGTPALAPYLGRTFYLAVVSVDPASSTLRRSSAARTLLVVP